MTDLRSGRGRRLFDAILGPHTEADVEAGLAAAEAWLLASLLVVAVSYAADLLRAHS